MRIRGNTLHLLTVAWVIAWVATVPLFHTHLPDVDNGAALRQGLAHTVFSPDLPGEFSFTHGSVLHLSTKAQNSPELGFVISTEESQKRTYDEPSTLAVDSGPFERRLSSTSGRESLEPPPRSDLLDGHQTSRAPPFVVFS